MPNEEVIKLLQSALIEDKKVNKYRPNDVNKCLKILSQHKYRAFGFRYVFLGFGYDDNKWSVTFRNPRDFDNPGIREDSPLEACHKMMDFLDTLKN